MHRVELQVPQVSSSPALARRCTISFLTTHGGASLAPDATLVVSELVTNAICYGAEPIRLTLEIGTALRIEVEDGDPHTDRVTLGPGESGMPGGHGLRLVELLAQSWGVAQHVDGKTVWAELCENCRG